ncbi:hypothetical protein CMI48_01775 [Candidatus Pacearchaeota archaeon]|jgi:hypothetical protein|nr:hypothetical protein [Candidatus Pacearchaeota archaeon]
MGHLGAIQQAYWSLSDQHKGHLLRYLHHECPGAGDNFPEGLELLTHGQRRAATIRGAILMTEEITEALRNNRKKMASTTERIEALREKTKQEPSYTFPPS